MKSDDPRVVYFLNILNDLYPGDWTYDPSDVHPDDHDFYIVDFYRGQHLKKLNWLRFDTKDGSVRGRGCTNCRNAIWGWWTDVDYSNDSHVRSIIDKIVGIDCACGRQEY